MADLDFGPCSNLSPDWPFGLAFPKMVCIELVFWLGIALGSMAFGWTADLFGAKPTRYVSTLLVGAS